MSFLKRGELIDLNPSNIQDPASVIPAIEASALEDFKKFAANLKRIAPKAEDFLYFSAVMMHAAEAALVNEDGTPKMTAKGEAATGTWDNSGGTWRWKTNDPSLKPVKNSNGDIFPESELVKAHKKWIGKPLCIDHKSSSVDHVRGFIVDTYYDRALKRVIALCALDKFNYPDLARKVATGYSNSVSMGTAVGKAICYDCGTVAKTEQDFCNHMRSRSCYGEINVDLNPIELSIVVNGADPNAKIKHIIAAANTLSSYVELKEQEFNKIAGTKFHASLHSEDKEESKFADIHINSDDLESFKKDLVKAADQLESIKNSLNDEKLSKDTNDLALSQTRSSATMEEPDLETTDFSLAPPTARFASEVELNDQLKVMQSKLTAMQKNLEKLATEFTNSSNKQEEIMSGSKDNDLNKKAYFQGAGGVNEPTPGKPKYEKDPLNEDLRNNEDKQMVGAKPFPEVGSVEGMYPGMDGDELNRKKMLARAEADERAMRRTAIVEQAKAKLEQKKTAYFQGGGDVNEPTPGKVKYPADKLNEQLRDKEDKQMVGQKPFPGVGDVDGLHPSPASADQKDELKRKELLSRAGLVARFVKAAKSDGSQDLANSAWEVYLGDKLLLTASVNDITGGRAELLYTGVATKEYGAELIAKVRKEGAEKVSSLFKQAQEAPAPTPPADLPAAEPTGDATAPADAPLADATDAGKDGDVKEKALDLAEQATDVVSDLNEAVRALTGEQAEMGKLEASESTAALQTMRKELNGALVTAMEEAVSTLNDHKEELATIVAMYDSGTVTETNKDFVGSLVNDAMVEGKEAVADAVKLLGAFSKYARGTHAITKRAEEELNQANGEEMKDDSLMAMVEEPEHMSAEDALDAMLAEDTAAVEDALKADDNEAGEEPKDVVVQASLDTTTKQGRAAARAKLAAEMKWNPLLEEAHKLVDSGPALDVKPSDGLGDVETIEERHEKMLEVAKTQPKVRKEAEMIHKLVSEGKLAKEDVDQLVANGVDADAVKYYKQFWGEAGSEGSQFASELVKEHAKAQMEAEMNLYRVKLARAYELTYEMIDNGMVARDKSAVNSQVNEIMKWNDESFESVKKVIANNKVPMRKEAGRLPQVGIIGLNDGAVVESDDLQSQLNHAFAKSAKRAF